MTVACFFLSHEPPTQSLKNMGDSCETFEVQAPASASHPSARAQRTVARRRTRRRVGRGTKEIGKPGLWTASARGRNEGFPAGSVFDASMRPVKRTGGSNGDESDSP